MAVEDPTYDFVISRLASGQEIDSIALELTVAGVNNSFANAFAYIFNILADYTINEFRNYEVSFEVFWPIFIQTYSLKPVVQTIILNLLLKSTQSPQKAVIEDILLHTLSNTLITLGVAGFIETMLMENGQSSDQALILLLINMALMISTARAEYIPIVRMITNYISEKLDDWPDKSVKGIKEYFRINYGVSEETASIMTTIFMNGFALTLTHLGPAGTEEFLHRQGYRRQFITEIFKLMSSTYGTIMANVMPFANSSIEALLARVPANATNAALARNILRHKYSNLESFGRQEEARRLYGANMNAAASGGAAAARHPTITANQAERTARYRRNTARPIKPEYVHAEWTPAAQALSPIAPQHFLNKEPPIGAIFEEGHPNYRVSWNNQQAPISQKKRSRRNLRAANKKRGRTRGNGNNNSNNNSNNNGNNNSVNINSI